MPMLQRGPGSLQAGVLVSDFRRDDTVTARKAHTCEECPRPIKPGDTYVRHVGCWEGEFYSVASCVRCARLRTKVIERYPPVYWDEGPAFGELLEYVRESRR